MRVFDFDNTIYDGDRPGRYSPGCRRLGVQHCICSVVDRQTLTVEYINFSANKVSAFRKCFGASAVPDAFYTDNAADLPMIHLSRTAYKVRRNRITRIK